MHGGKCTTFFRIPGVLHLHFECILKTPSLIFKYLQSIRNRKIIEKSFLSESWVKMREIIRVIRGIPMNKFVIAMDNLKKNS